MSTDELTAGRELDALIAERVMGWERLKDTQSPLWRAPDPTMDYHSIEEYPRPYSTDIAAAWQVIARLTDSDGPFGRYKWSLGMEYSSVVDWVVDFTPRRNHVKSRDYPAFQASGISAPEAICRAALAAVASLEVDAR